MNTITITNSIKDFLIHAIRSMVKRGFELSQIKVPVITGALKNSGSEKEVENGATIGYSKEYSSYVHFGTKAGVRNVKDYNRKDGAHVKGFSYYSKGIKPNPFVEQPLTETFEKDFADNFENELRKLGKVTRRIG